MQPPTTTQRKGAAAPDAYAEPDCTFRFQGRAFEAGGAVVTPDYLIAYPADGGRLNDWHGRQIGTYRVLSGRPAVFFGRRSWQGSRWLYMRASVNGREYTLRGFGVGMIARGKALKAQGGAS